MAFYWVKQDKNFFAQDGFTIVELIATVAIFGILLAGILGVFATLSNSVKAARQKTIVASLAADYMEVVRNLPYSQIGTISGNPPGSLPDLSNAFSQTLSGTAYKIYYEVTFIHDPADSNPVAADYKQVKMSILNTASGAVAVFLSNVSPNNLAGQSGGAIQIQVFDAQGNPVSGANIQINYPATSTSPSLILNRTSDATGQWLEVGLQPGVNAYHIVVSKNGYSADQTYPKTFQNPNPTKPDVTVINGQVVKVSFAIDLLSQLTIKTLNQFCGNINGVSVNVEGAKLIGTSPNVYKYNQNFISGPSQFPSGQIVLNNLEWDTYTPSSTSASLVVMGTSPIQKIAVLPGTNQTFTILLANNATAYSLLVIVKDASTQAAVEGASVFLQKGGSQPQNYGPFYTGGSVWVQNDWTGGSGQAQWSTTTPDVYYQDDGNIDINSVPTGVRLQKTSGRYATSGFLISSTFDTGASTTNYTTLTWQPASQSSSTALQLQLAANNDNATWNFVGPDGTANTYYTTPGVNISSSLDNNRFVRYKVFLSTSDTKYTPVLTSVNVNYVSGCFTPGQMFFPNLTAGNNYTLTVSASGYQSQTIDSLDITGNQSIEILLSP